MATSHIQNLSMAAKDRAQHVIRERGCKMDMRDEKK